MKVKPMSVQSLEPRHDGKPVTVARTELVVGGMSCSNCARHVTEAIQSVPGVASAAVNLEEGRARISWTDHGNMNVPAVLQAVAKAGYEAKEVEEAEQPGCHEHG